MTVEPSTTLPFTVLLLSTNHPRHDTAARHRHPTGNAHGENARSAESKPVPALFTQVKDWSANCARLRDGALIAIRSPTATTHEPMATWRCFPLDPGQRLLVLQAKGADHDQPRTVETRAGPAPDAPNTTFLRAAISLRVSIKPPDGAAVSAEIAPLTRACRLIALASNNIAT